MYSPLRRPAASFPPRPNTHPEQRVAGEVPLVRVLHAQSGHRGRAARILLQTPGSCFQQPCHFLLFAVRSLLKLDLQERKAAHSVCAATSRLPVCAGLGRDSLT